MAVASRIWVACVIRLPSSWRTERLGGPAIKSCSVVGGIGSGGFSISTAVSPSPGAISASKCGWRRGRDSNPRYPFKYSGFQDRRHQPLGHPSARSLSRNFFGAVHVRSQRGRNEDGTVL